MRDLLEKLAQGTVLNRVEAREVMGRIMDGEATGSQIGALLMALRLRGESVQELTGFAEAMRERVTVVPITRRPVLDTCGTGGDQSHSINVSTVAGLVAAGAGVPVAKHGNRSVSSRSGSADLLEALGAGIPGTAEEAARSVDEVGFGFMFAPLLHASMRHAMPTRRELGIRTVFNLLGPLTNPAGAEYQLLGVFSPTWVRPMAEVLADLGVRRALVVHGSGLDEVSLAGPTLVAEVRDGTVREFTVEPVDLGFSAVAADTVRGGDPSENARIAEDILAGRPSPARDTVVVNAGFALYAADQASDLIEGIRAAAAALDTGGAYRVLSLLRQRAEAHSA